MHDPLPPTDPVPPATVPEAASEVAPAMDREAAPEAAPGTAAAPAPELAPAAVEEPVSQAAAAPETPASPAPVDETIASVAEATSPTPTTAPGTPPPLAAAAATAADLSPAATGRRLAELFPALFAGGAKPLKLRIQADIQQRAPGVFSRKALSIFLHRHTTSTAYLRAMAQQASRFDLDGQPAGEIAEEHRSAAAAELQRRRGIVEAKREAERTQQREAEGQARVAEAAARRERSALLRAYETTTLTRPNFCALKGLTETQLDEQLALARQEAAERARWLAEHPAPAREPGPTREGRPPRPPRPERPRAERAVPGAGAEAPPADAPRPGRGAHRRRPGSR